MKTNFTSFDATLLCNHIEKISEYFKSPITNNIIEIPKSIGNGFIKNLMLEKGFCIRYYNFNLKKDLEFQWKPEPLGNNQVFKLITYLESTNNIEYVSLQNICNSYETENSTILYTEDFQRNGLIKKNTQINRIIFLFTKNWLSENFIEASESINKIILNLVQNNNPAFITEKMINAKLIRANELATEISRNDFSLLQIKTESLILLTNFLNNLVKEKNVDFYKNYSIPQHKIKEITNRLDDFLYTTLPTIFNLASEFNMSKATLQRHFKNEFGKSIYHYYLEKKLAIGKDLIMERNKTISEIAYTLGYNKINSFSKAFKKHYGILPKEVKFLRNF